MRSKRGSKSSFFSHMDSSCQVGTVTAAHILMYIDFLFLENFKLAVRLLSLHSAVGTQRLRDPQPYVDLNLLGELFYCSISLFGNYISVKGEQLKGWKKCINVQEMNLKLFSFSFSFLV